MTGISKNTYFDDIVDKYNNTVHRTIKIKPIEVTDNYYAEYNEIPNKKNPKFKVGDNVRISKYKNILAKGYIGQKKFLLLIKLKILMLLVMNGEEIIGIFYEKELQKTNQKEFRIEKYLKEKVINYMSNAKDIIIHVIGGLIKKI